MVGSFCRVNGCIQGGVIREECLKRLDGDINNVQGHVFPASNFLKGHIDIFCKPVAQRMPDCVWGCISECYSASDTISDTCR